MGNKSKQHPRNIKARKRLQALYARGTVVRFNADGWEKGPFEEPLGPDDEDTVEIYVCAPSPLQREQALREAQAARARASLAAKDENSDTNEAVMARGWVANLSLDGVIDNALELDEGERRASAEREVLSREEWEDFDALMDAMRQWDEAGNPRTEEWQPLIERDLEFGRQLREEANRRRADDRESMKMLPRKQLEERVFTKRIELAGTQAFMAKYEEQMLLYACRDPEDHDELFFFDGEELLSQDDLVQEALTTVLAEFIKDPREAKNSQRAESGSEQSEPPVEPEISEASIPEESKELVTSPGTSK